MTKPEFIIGHDATTAFQSVEKYLQEKDFKIISKALDKPWGGFYVLDNAMAERFACYFFPDDAQQLLKSKNKLSPKILVVAPGKRLSWQYHNRREELWKLIAGRAGFIRSDSNEMKTHQEIKMGEIVRLKVGERHRLTGMPEGWGAVAEVWIHTDATNASDESDIIRLQDDFNRR